MNAKSSPVLTFALRIWLGLIFSYAGFIKVMEPVENFRGMLAEYQVFPHAMLQPVAVMVPWLELLSGIFMLLGLALPLASLMMCFLCTGFLIVLGASNMILDGANHDCGCFGHSGPFQMKVWQVFIMDAVNLLIAGKIFLQRKTIWSLDGFLSGGKTGRGRD